MDGGKRGLVQLAVDNPPIYDGRFLFGAANLNLSSLTPVRMCFWGEGPQLQSKFSRMQMSGIFQLFSVDEIERVCVCK